MRLVSHTTATYTLALTLVLSLSACTSPTGTEPPVADSTFVNVLVELHLAKARAEILQQTPSKALRDSILARYALNAQRLDATLDYYAHHPDAYAALYETVMNRLRAERAQVNSGGG